VTPGARLTPEVLAAAIDRVRSRLRYDVARRRAYGELLPIDESGCADFAREVIAELAALEQGAAPHVIAGEEPTEASAPPRPRTTTRSRFG